MKKAFRNILIVIGIIVVFMIVLFQVGLYTTTQASPKHELVYEDGDRHIEVVYSRPVMKDRLIFGGLVPFGSVWRTGANDATTFTSNHDLWIQGKKLPAGKYTLWTIPEMGRWTVIWNSGQYFWGVDLDEKASRDPDLDVITALATPIQIPFAVDTFTIDMEGSPTILSLTWENTHVEVQMDWVASGENDGFRQGAY